MRGSASARTFVPTASTGDVGAIAASRLGRLLLLVAALLPLGAGACGGKQASLTIAIVVPAVDDPFATAAAARISVGTPPVAQKTVAVVAGHFDASIAYTPGPTPLVTQATVEALAADGSVIARGRSPAFALAATDVSLAVWVGRPGRIGLSSAALSRARLGTAIGAIPRVGAAAVGGSVDGTPVGDTDIYDVYLHRIFALAPTPVARTGATLFGLDRVTASTGLALLAGGGMPELSAFDPSTNQWATVATDASLARSGASLGALAGNTSLLFAGGRDALGKPYGSAALIRTTSGVSARSTAAPMLAARVGHTITPATFAGDPGALVFGGASTGPVAERYSTATGTFLPFALPDGTIGRSRHTATVLPDGRILVAGGSDAGGAPLSSSLLIDPTTLAVSPRSDIPTVARSGHVAFRDGTLLLLCGGVGSAGTPRADCDVVDMGSLTTRALVPLPTARTDLSAVELESGETLLAGGSEAMGKPSVALELYTPITPR